MIEVSGDIWMYEPVEAIVITTNGDVNRFGDAVMGRGVARQCRTLWPTSAGRLGDHIKLNGNHVHLFYQPPESPALLSFPVKHHWQEEADPLLIARSAHELAALVTKLEYFKVVLPRPGCGNGRLMWAQVKPIIEPILDERFIVVNNEVVG